MQGGKPHASSQASEISEEIKFFKWQKKTRKPYRGCQTRKHIKQGSKTREKKTVTKVYVKQQL